MRNEKVAHSRKVMARSPSVAAGQQSDGYACRVEQTVVRGGALPSEVRAALHVGEEDEVAFVDTGRGIVVVPADQAWYWTSEWQEGEREADRQLARGELSEVFASAEEMFDHLDRQAGA